VIFFTKNSASDKGLPLIVSEKIYCPKKFGGLGLQNTMVVNTASLLKLV